MSNHLRSPQALKMRFIRSCFFCVCVLRWCVVEDRFGGINGRQKDGMGGGEGVSAARRISSSLSIHIVCMCISLSLASPSHPLPRGPHDAHGVHRVVHAQAEARHEDVPVLELLLGLCVWGGWGVMGSGDVMECASLCCCRAICVHAGHTQQAHRSMRAHTSIYSPSSHTPHIPHGRAYR